MPKRTGKGVDELKISGTMKVVIAAILLTVIFFGALIIYVNYVFSEANAAARSQLKASPPHVGISMSDEELLSYDYAAFLYPYLDFSYITSNASMLNINASLYDYRPPERIFLLNYTNACYECGNVTAVVRSLKANLTRYGLGAMAGNMTLINVRDIASLPNDSILVILNGLLPINFDNTTTPIVQTLLQRHTSIIYVGQNFSVQMVVGASSTQELVGSLPAYLQYLPPVTPKPEYKNGPPNGRGFYFDKGTFSFQNASAVAASAYGYLTYLNAFNGSIVAFPNTLASWKSPAEAGSDIAKAIQEMFWLPKYAQGHSSAQIGATPSGHLGVILNAIPANLSASEYNTGYIRAIIGANSSINSSYSVFHYILTKPAFTSNGTVSASPSYAPGSNYMRFTFMLNNAPVNATKLSAFLYIYDQNMSVVVPPTNASTVPDFSASSPPFILISNNTLGPGNYEVVLRNFTGNKEMAAGYFNISPVSFNFVSGNFTYNKFLFAVTSEGVPLSGIPYSLTFDNQYPQNGIVRNGFISYTLPPATPTPSPYVFKIVFYSVPHYVVIYRYSQALVISSEYIEILLAAVMVAIMVVFVRAPSRDEFYIDVPNLPEGKKTPVMIKANEIVSIFQKLNQSYHWKYMPLSLQEIRSAIAANLRYNNIPIYLTHSNLNSMLDALQVNGFLESTDGLYAPAIWTKESGHDMEYLAVFKKLRVYFVTHSYLFTDIDQSEEADIVATFHGEKSHIMIYSKTSKFLHVPMYPGAKTYLVFLNSYKLEEFKDRLHESMAHNAETLRMYIESDYLRLADADNFEG